MKAISSYIRKRWPKISIRAVRGKKKYLVDARKIGTQGRREFFETKQEAESRAQQIEEDFKANGVEGLALPIQLRAMAIRCQRLLDQHEKTLDDATGFYLEHLRAVIERNDSAVISRLADEWLNYKRAGNGKQLRKKTLESMAEASNALKRAFGEKRILEIKEKDVANYIHSLSVSQRRKFNVRSLFSQFFNWCVKHHYTNNNPAKGIEIEVPSKDPEIFDADFCQKVMRVCEAGYPDMTLYHAICLFAGLRPTECQLLKWENVHLAERQITVRGDTSKVKETRNVPIEDNLASWLESYEGERKGFVTRQINLRKRLVYVRQSLGFKLEDKNPDGPEWIEDVMRHSYALYWLGKMKDRAHLAENMGTSLKMISQHYKSVVSNSEVEKFWCILPASVVEAQKRAKEEKLGKIVNIFG